ncbi:putative Two pore calcium channel protein 1, plant [Helianthus annuus]|nr:putative Two pore calcium channel protein 1, plant [Helianthus annuus]
MTDPFTPLLGGETRRGGRKPFIRRWAAIAYGSPYQKAAALLDLAANGRGLPEGTFDVPNYEASVKLYFIFIRFDIIWTLALIALHFFEVGATSLLSAFMTRCFFCQPLWCSSISEVSCRNRDYYYLGELPYLTSAESLAFKVGSLIVKNFLMQGVTLVILVVHTLFPILFEGGYFYSRNHVNKLKVISLLILSVDLVVDILHLSPVTICRIAPYIRVLFFIWNIRGLRDNLIVLGGMVVTYVNVLALWFLFLVFSSWLAYVIFEDTQQGTTFFLSYSATLYQMFVLFTTSNNPDVWIPAYKSSRWSSLFFILYVLLGVYFVTNLVLAVIYDSFKLELLKQVVAKGDMRTGTLRMVFNLIDSRGAGYLDKEQCFKLLEELNNYRTLPKISKEDFELIFNTLDHIGNDKVLFGLLPLVEYTIELLVLAKHISAEEFNDIYDAIALGFQMEDTEPWLTKFVFYNSSTSETLKNFVKSTKFGNIVAFVLLLNLATVIVETTLNIQNNSGQNFWQRVEFVFGWIYALEMALKVYTYGFENFWKDGQNQFDFIITLVIGEFQNSSSNISDYSSLSN